MDVCVIFYPGGYSQLQVADDGDDFCHVYDNPGNLAKDVSRLLGGDNAIGWYGNDPDAWLDPEATEECALCRGRLCRRLWPGWKREKSMSIPSGTTKPLFTRHSCLKDRAGEWDMESRFSGIYPVCGRFRTC